ncbi:Meiotic recombination protein DMC1/LIM15-like protein [Trichoplax sp. H2]|nr:Meiotic recombination protein DMC1/LIM15-like protein [Trichoplax sp. H2]|eukprot:RDD46632.1 Meiotic recombination protein DMC1/LIM15-like protein [Trichoplax sp. H2]
MSCEQCQSDEEEFENSADIQKVKKGGIYTIGGVLTNTKKQLCTIKGISEAKVDKLKEAAIKLCGNGFLTALEYGEKRRRVFKISTGSNELDTILGGGIESMSITEFFGEFRTGKTQIVHTICATCQIPGEDYEGGKALVLDTEGTFRPDRLRTIANRFDLDENEVLTNIAYRRVYNSEHLATSIIEAAGEFYEERKIYKLLIIDSLTHPFRTDFCGRGELADRQQKLGQVLSKLQKVAEDGFGSGRFQVDPKKPVGGHILAHASTNRISLRKGRGETRIAKIYDSPDRAENEAMFAITEGGVADAKE